MGMTKMRNTAKALIMATTALCFTMPCKYSYSQIPVTDVAAEAALSTQIAHQLEMITYLSEQLSALGNLVSLSVVASTALGDTVSPELNALFSSMQDAYSSTNKTYGSLMAVPGRVDSELSLFEAPPAGWSSMTTSQLLARAQQIRKLTAGTNSAAVARQADVIERRAEIAAQAARANGMADRSVSALSATQAVAQQMRVSGQILAQIEEHNSDIATSLAEKVSQDQTDKGITDGLRQMGKDAWKRMVDTGPERPKLSPLKWGD